MPISKSNELGSKKEATLGLHSCGCNKKTKKYYSYKSSE